MFSELDVDWNVWRVVVAQYATLTEIQTSWYVEDLIDAHAILDAYDAIDAKRAQDIDK